MGLTRLTRAPVVGQPTLKTRGRMFACVPSHKSAEPDSLVVMMAFEARDALIADDPETYYVKAHYLAYPCVLVRLARVHPDALRDLVIGAPRRPTPLEMGLPDRMSPRRRRCTRGPRMRKAAIDSRLGHAWQKLHSSRNELIGEDSDFGSNLQSPRRVRMPE